MRVHLINPNDMSFGIGVITPRWLYVIAAATPQEFGDPVIVDETLAPVDFGSIQPGDAVGIGIHTGNALRGYTIGRLARERGAHVIFGGIHASLYPEEAFSLGGAHAVVKGDGDAVWPLVLRDCAAGTLQAQYDGGRIESDRFLRARWDLMPRNKYMWASVQTVRGCPKHCSFCSVWRTDGQRPRQSAAEGVIREMLELRSMGFRFIVLADDNFYPVTFEDMNTAERQNARARLDQLHAIRNERFELMRRMAELPKDMMFFTQITMEAAEDEEFLAAMQKARIVGALVGIESVTPEGLKAIHKEFNSAGDTLVRRLRTFRQFNIKVLGSFIFGLPTDRPETFKATAKLADEADLAFAQFVLLTPLPGTLDFLKWEKLIEADPVRIAGFPLSRYWLIPQGLRPRVYMSHPVMAADEIRKRTQDVWDRFYSLPLIWKRAAGCAKSLRSRLMFVLISKLYRQMYANTGIATDSARVKRAGRWARWLAKPCLKLFRARPMPELSLDTSPQPH